MAKVVIMDAGIGDMSLAYEIRTGPGREHEVLAALRMLKVRKDDTDPAYEKFLLTMIGIEKLKTWGASL